LIPGAAHKSKTNEFCFGFSRKLERQLPYKKAFIEINLISKFISDDF
jgi:hypothetical protein